MGELSETAVQLRFGGDDLDPAEVSRLLGATPTRGYRRGEVRILRNGQESICDTGHWSLSVVRVRPGNLDAQIAELLAPLNQDLTIWQNLSRRFNGFIFAGLFLENWNEGIGLEPRTMIALGSRGLHLDMDIYGAADEKE